MSRSQRDKAACIGREIVQLHRCIGIHAERVPLSGTSHFRSGGHDADLYSNGKDAPPLCCTVKVRGNGSGCKTVETWLGDNDALFLRRDRALPLALLPRRMCDQFLAAMNPGLKLDGTKGPQS